MQEKRPSNEGGGMFIGGDGPTPPPALSLACVGMRKGGVRSVLVPPEQGYKKQMMELPTGEPFELLVEVLQVF